MQSERKWLGVAVLNDRIYAVGGRGNSRQKELNTAEVLDLIVEGTPYWRSIASMSTKRANLAVGVLNGKIYAVGGHDENQTLSSVECYDPEQNVWSPVADLSVPRNGAGVGVLDGALYCVGGIECNTVEKYSEDTNTWSQAAEMKYHRCDNPGVLIHEGRMYVVAGHDYCLLLLYGDV